MKKQIISLLLITTVLTGAVSFFVPQAYARTPETNRHMNFFQEFIQFISQKFGLDKTQVQTAITDFKNQKKATITPRPTLTLQQMADREKTRLDKLVTDGKITPDQETEITGEQTALKTKYNSESMKNLTPEQRKTRTQAIRDEIVSWAKSHEIDSSYVMPGYGINRKGPGMNNGRNGGWEKPNDDNSSTPN